MKKAIIFLCLFFPFLAACEARETVKNNSENSIAKSISTDDSKDNTKSDNVEVMLGSVNRLLDKSELFTACFDINNEIILLEATEDNFDNLHSLVSGFMDEQQAQLTLEDYKLCLVNVSAITKDIPVTIMSPAADDFLLFEAINGEITQNHLFEEGSNEGLQIIPDYSHDKSDGIYDFYDDTYVSYKTAMKAVVHYFRRFAEDGSYDPATKTFDLNASSFYLYKLKENSFDKTQEIALLRKAFNTAAKNYGDDIVIIVNSTNDSDIVPYAIFTVDKENVISFDD